jgi:hypothetical protein
VTRDLDLFRLTYQAAVNAVWRPDDPSKAILLPEALCDRISDRMGDQSFARLLQGFSAVSPGAYAHPVEQSAPQVDVIFEDLKRDYYPVVLLLSGSVLSTATAVYASKVLGYRSDEVLLLGVSYGDQTSRKRRQTMYDWLVGNGVAFPRAEATVMRNGVPSDQECAAKLQDIFLSQLAACFGRTVWFGSPDAPQELCGQMTEAATCYHREPVQVVSPTWHIEKTELLALLGDTGQNADLAECSRRQ